VVKISQNRGAWPNEVVNLKVSPWNFEHLSLRIGREVGNSAKIL